MALKNTTFSHLKDILDTQLKTLVGDRFAASMTVRKHWPKIVGPLIASRSRVLFVKNDVLYVGVDNAAWHNELSLMKDQIIAHINKGNFGTPVKDVKFKIN